MRRLALLIAACAGLPACLLDVPYDGADDDGEGAGSGTAPFARGETVQDQATLWAIPAGRALGTDAFGAFGMVGMVCSFATTDGFLRVDVDTTDGEDVVVDAVSAAGGGFLALALDGPVATISAFPGEWDGGVVASVELRGAVETAALAGTAPEGALPAVVWAGTDDGACVVRSAHPDGGSAPAAVLDGACRSPVEAFADGTAFIATASGTYAVAPDGTHTHAGPPADHLALGPDGTLVLATGDGELTAIPVDGPGWMASIGDALVGIVPASDGRWVAALAHGELVVLAADGAVIERVPTEGEISGITASPTGRTLAIDGPNALHLVAVR